MNLYDEKIIVAIEDAIQNMVEASGITADIFRLDGDRVIDALLQALGDDYVIVPKKPSEEFLSKAIRRYLEVSDLSVITSRMFHLYELMAEEAARGGNE